MIEEMKKAFEQWIEEEDPFPGIVIEWDHYSANVTTVFFRAKGEWNLDTRKEISKFLRQYKKKVLAGFIIRGEKK